jgi:hypothetical protein
MKTKALLGLVAGISLAASLTAQSSSSAYSLKGKHQFTFGLGALTESVNGDDWGVGSFEYNYWISESLAVKASGFGMGSDDDWEYDHYEDYGEYRDSVGAALFGIELRPDFLNFSKRVFLTVNAMGGFYVNDTERKEWIWDGDRRYTRKTDDSDTVFGAYVGGKLNVALSRSFLVGAAAGYHFMDDFEVYRFGKRDLSSPDFRVTFGFLF